MASLRIQTGWPSSNLSPNGRPNRWQKAKSLRQAKNEGFIATFAARAKVSSSDPDRLRSQFTLSRPSVGPATRQRRRERQGASRRHRRRARRRR